MVAEEEFKILVTGPRKKEDQGILKAHSNGFYFCLTFCLTNLLKDPLILNRSVTLLKALTKSKACRMEVESSLNSRIKLVPNFHMTFQLFSKMLVHAKTI